MHRVIYVSRSLVRSEPDSFKQIVLVSAQRNMGVGVTGMLWSDGEQFVQALEGNETAVAASMRRIMADRRHADVEIVEARPIQTPRFGAWAMIEAGESALGDECGVFLVGLVTVARTSAKQRVLETVLRTIE